MTGEVAPKGLGTGGRKLWRSIVSEYTLRPDELSLLEDACREVDIIERLEEQLQTASLITKGSMGQDVASPYLTEIRQHRNAKRSLLSALRLPDDPSGQGSADSRSEAGRAMNVIRWGGRRVS